MIDDQKIIDNFKKSGINSIDKFFAIPKEFIISKNTNKKISINKSELIKLAESEYILKNPKSYDKENRKFEEDVVTDVSEWIKDREKNLKSELKDFYGELNY